MPSGCWPSARTRTCCRGEGIDVIHLQARFQPDGSDWMVNARLRGRTPCIEGTAGAQTLGFAAFTDLLSSLKRLAQPLGRELN